MYFIVTCWDYDDGEDVNDDDVECGCNQTWLTSIKNLTLNAAEEELYG